jgi:DNA-binding NarL/FixJ family response regulator
MVSGTPRIRELMARGPDGYLTKPLDLHRLLRLVQNILESR